MNIRNHLLVVTIIIGLGFSCLDGAHEQTQKDIETLIWKLEGQYWDYWTMADIEGYLSLIHEGFIGWPSSSQEPEDKAAAREFVLNYWSQNEASSYEIEPAAIRIFANAAVVHYIIDFKDQDGNQLGSAFRITHTWIQQDGCWKIIGGMSSQDKK